MSSEKLVREGFEYRHNTLDEIYDNVVEYGKAVGILPYWFKLVQAGRRRVSRLRCTALCCNSLWFPIEKKKSLKCLFHRLTLADFYFQIAGRHACMTAGATRCARAWEVVWWPNVKLQFATKDSYIVLDHILQELSFVVSRHMCTTLIRLAASFDFSAHPAILAPWAMFSSPKPKNFLKFTITSNLVEHI